LSVFDYVRAGSIDEAVTTLAKHGSDARPLAGGQSLVPLINLGLAQPELLVDVGHIRDITSVEVGAESIRIGASATYASTATAVRSDLPLLAQAIAAVGSARVRNIGTIGGAVAHADPSAEAPLALCALGARYEIASPGGTRRSMAAEDFAIAPYTTMLDQGELVVAVHVNKPRPGTGWGFHEFSRRVGDFAIVAAAATARCNAGRVEEGSVWLVGVGGAPVRCRSLEAALPGASISGLADLAGLVDEDVNPTEDVFVPMEFRAHLARVLAIRALTDACRRSAEVES